ncbi:hypothetical protein HDV02_003458 [Globomyces sp. JEL0801]|nr:hypothetical protein HDV02_003458 [Globomyces sp. JEL0801]
MQVKVTITVKNKEQNPICPCKETFKWEGNPSGQSSSFAGFDSYITDKSLVKSTDAVILYIHDAMGWKFGNGRLLADAYAFETGLQVIMPDLFNGALWCSASAKECILQGKPLAEDDAQFSHCTVNDKLVWGEEFRANIVQEDVVQRLETIIGALREQYPNAKIFSTGFCWGGKYSTMTGILGLVDAFATHHPTGSKTLDLTGIKIPGIFNISDDDISPDGQFPQTLIDTVQALVSPPQELYVYENMFHGFTSRGNPETPLVMEAQILALNRTVTFFRSQLISK